MEPTPLPSTELRPQRSSRPPRILVALFVLLLVWSLGLRIWVAAPAIDGPLSAGGSTTAGLLWLGLDALLGTLSLVLLYRIGSRLYGPWTGLLAAAILAACGRHMLNSTVRTPDLLVLVLVTLTFLWSLDAPRAETLRPYLKVGLGVGLAAAVRLAGVAAALPIAFAGLTEGWRERRRWLWLGLTGLTSLLVFLALHPLLRALLERIPRASPSSVTAGVAGVEGVSPHGLVFATPVRFLVEQHGGVVAVFVGLGTLGLLLRALRPAPEDPPARTDGTRLVLALLLGYPLLLGFGRVLLREESYLPVAPFSSLAAAWALVELYRLTAARLRKPG